MKYNIYVDCLWGQSLYLETYRSGHNGHDSKKSVVIPDLLVTIRLTTAFVMFRIAFSQTAISQFSRNSVIRLCLYNLIRRRIEVVITGLTRKKVLSFPTYLLQSA